MSAETDLYAALSGASAVTAIVGTRIYPDAVPQDVKGASVAYARLGTEFVSTIHAAAPIGGWASIEVVCMAAKRADADDLAGKVNTAAAGAGFVLVDQRAEFDSDLGLWATVLTLRKWTT